MVDLKELSISKSDLTHMSVTVWIFCRVICLGPFTHDLCRHLSHLIFKY